jgi:cobalt-zinc-cadmium efflux system membrane fusion protein
MNTFQSPAARAGSTGLSRRQQWTILGAAALLILALFFGAPMLARLFAPKPPPPPAAPPPGTFAATPEQWETLKFEQVGLADFHAQAVTDGEIAVDDDLTTPIFSPYSGRVTKVFAAAGDTVRAGQPLFALAASEFVQGQSDLVTAAANEKVALATETRQHALYESSGAALKDWQQSQTDLAAAEAALQAARGRLKVLGKSDGEIDAMQASPAKPSSSAEAVVTSPIAGVVIQKAVGLGQTIGSVTNGGTSPAYTVSNLAKVWLVGNVRDADAVAARPGQRVQVKVNALPGQIFNAKVDYVSPTVDPATHRVAVRATLDNPGMALKPQMFAQFEVITGAAQKSTVVPEDAVIFEGDQARVWVADPSTKTLGLRQIKAGQVVGDQVQVLSGLTPGEWIVTSGSLFIDRTAKPD